MKVESDKSLFKHHSSQFEVRLYSICILEVAHYWIYFKSKLANVDFFCLFPTKITNFTCSRSVCLQNKLPYIATSIKGHLDCKQVFVFLPDAKQKKIYIYWPKFVKPNTRWRFKCGVWSFAQLQFSFYSSWNVQKSDHCTVFNYRCTPLAIDINLPKRWKPLWKHFPK